MTRQRIWSPSDLDSLLTGSDDPDEAVFLEVDHIDLGFFPAMLYSVYTDGRVEVGLEDGSDITVNFADAKWFTV